MSPGQPPQVVYNVATTLDGFIASPDHSTPWIVDDPAIDFDALWARFSLLIMGRRTYEALLQDEDTARRLASDYFPRRAVVVVSSTMKEAEHAGLRVLASGEEVIRLIREMKEDHLSEKVKDIWAMGGGGLVGLLMREGLVDVVEAAIMPVVIGEGVKMIGFDADGKMREAGNEIGTAQAATVRLRLESCQRLVGSGILMTRYAVVKE